MIATHAPIECVKSLQDKHPDRFANLDSIREITVAQSKAPYEHSGQGVTRPLNAVGAQMSTRYVTAVQLVDRLVLMDQFNATNLDRDALWSLTDKIDCVRNKDFDDKGKWYTRLTVEFEDGSELVEESPNSRTIADPLPNEGIQSKWSMLADTVMHSHRRDQIEACVLSLERQADITDLTRLLEAEVQNPIS
ncbi:hypothetical protein MMC18_001941 [Xylographa bjoerkii]|nr:hypothetical protein [Xylographa bjoerkii]